VNVEDAIAETMQKQNNVTQQSTQHRIATSMQQSKSQTSHPMNTSSSNNNSSSNSSHFPSSSSSSLLGYYPEHDMYVDEGISNNGKFAEAMEDRLPLPMLSPVPVALQENNHNVSGVANVHTSVSEVVVAWLSSLLSSLVACSNYDAALAVSFFFLWLAIGVLWTQVHPCLT